MSLNLRLKRGLALGEWHSSQPPTVECTRYVLARELGHLPLSTPPTTRVRQAKLRCGCSCNMRFALAACTRTFVTPRPTSRFNSRSSRLRSPPDSAPSRPRYLPTSRRSISSTTRRDPSAFTTSAAPPLLVSVGAALRQDPTTRFRQQAACRAHHMFAPTNL